MGRHGLGEDSARKAVLLRGANSRKTLRTCRVGEPADASSRGRRGRGVTVVDIVPKVPVCTSSDSVAADRQRVQLVPVRRRHGPGAVDDQHVLPHEGPACRACVQVRVSAMLPMSSGFVLAAMANSCGMQEPGRSGTQWTGWCKWEFIAHRAPKHSLQPVAELLRVSTSAPAADGGSDFVVSGAELANDQQRRSSARRCDVPAGCEMQFRVRLNAAEAHTVTPPRERLFGVRGSCCNVQRQEAARGR
jgi:hypothetical protein